MRILAVSPTAQIQSSALATIAFAYMYVCMHACPECAELDATSKLPHLKVNASLPSTI